MNTEPPQRPKIQPKVDVFTRKGTSGRKDGPEKSHSLLTVIKNNSKETVVYILIITALLMLLFDTTEFYGSLIIGLLLGVFFLDELSWVLRQSQELVEEYGLLKSIVLGGTLLALLIKAPIIVLAACAVLLFRLYLLP